MGASNITTLKMDLFASCQLKLVNVSLSALMEMELLSLFLPLPSSTRRVLLQVRVMKQEGPPGQLLLKCLPHSLKIQVPPTRLVWRMFYMAPQGLQSHRWGKVLSSAAAAPFAERAELRHEENLAGGAVLDLPVIQSSKIQIFVLSL